MDVFSVARACLRRWYIFLPLLVVTAAVSIFQAKGIKPQYSQSATVLILPSNSIPKIAADAKTRPINPLTTAKVAQQALVSRLNVGPGAANIAKTPGATAGYALIPVKGGGQLNVLTSGAHVKPVETTLQAVLAETKVQLRALQRDVRAPSGLYFQTYTLAVDGVGKAYPQRGRNITLTALAGVLLTILLTQIADSAVLAVGRRRRPTPRGRRARRSAAVGTVRTEQLASHNGVAGHAASDDSNGKQTYATPDDSAGQQTSFAPDDSVGQHTYFAPDDSDAQQSHAAPDDSNGHQTPETDLPIWAQRDGDGR